MPGAGKSTFIESLGMMLIRKGHKVAVLAVDPSSTKSGGSIMADKTRMEKLSTEKEAFIRPSPSRGASGGVAEKTRETMLVCEAAGFDVVIVETMGVGQSEIAAASMVDFFLVLMIAGAGDELQGMKKGIMELADAIVVNKADGNNIENAKLARKQYEEALRLLASPSSSWIPPALACSSTEMTGIDEVWEAVLKHREKLTSSGEMKTKRKRQNLDWMWFMVNEGLNRWFYENADVKKLIPAIVEEVENGKIFPSAAAEKLLSFLKDGKRN
jgi:LAO/AO transport system kinase